MKKYVKITVSKHDLKSRFIIGQYKKSIQNFRHYFWIGLLITFILLVLFFSILNYTNTYLHFSVGLLYQTIIAFVPVALYFHGIRKRHQNIFEAKSALISRIHELFNH